MHFLKPHLKRVRLLCMFLALATFGLSSQGCVAGNYNLLRIIANWNLKLHIVLRVLVYIVFVLLPVYAIAGLVDAVILNTIEFWTGHAVIKAQNDSFEKDGTKVQVAHFRDPFRRTVITSTDKNGVIRVTEMKETAQNSIEVYIDGVKKHEIKNIDRDVVQVSETTIAGTTHDWSLDTTSLRNLPENTVAANRVLVGMAVEEARQSSISGFSSTALACQ